MNDTKVPAKRVLGLRAGDWIEVRSRDEILSTLDEQGCLDSLPFMPEMLKYCGQRFRVYKSAHKTCDTIREYKIRSMANAVHLEGLRCDGEAHGGCQAGCLLFWKEAWLKPVCDRQPAGNGAMVVAAANAVARTERSRCSIQDLVCATRVPSGDGNQSEQYRCQATELLRATTPMQWWDPRQYLKDLTSGNVRLQEFVHYAFLAALNQLMSSYARIYSRLRSQPQILKLAQNRYRPPKVHVFEEDRSEVRLACHANDTELITNTDCACHSPSEVRIFARVLHLRGHLCGIVTSTLSAIKRLNSFLYSSLQPYPNVRGLAEQRTPTKSLKLQEGELVQVRSQDEIMRTIDANRRNRGLSFDVEMLPFCGKTFRVLRRVEKIINEKNGKMLRLPNACLILEGVTCSGCYSTNRMFCPRSIYPYWHEIWLKRVDQAEAKFADGKINLEKRPIFTLPSEQIPLPVEFLAYLLIGGFTAAIDLSAFIALLKFGIPLTPSIVASFGAAAIANFLLCTALLFPYRLRWGSATQLAMYGLIIAGAAAVDLGITSGFCALGTIPWVAKSLASTTCFGVNFLGRRLSVV